LPAPRRASHAPRMPIEERVAERHDDAERELRAQVEVGRAAWPCVHLQDAAFAARLREVATPGPLRPRDRAPDLFIAWACALEVPGAAAAFLRAYRPHVLRVAARIDPLRAEDAAQSVSVTLLVPTPSVLPKIAGYTGLVSLESWLTTVTTRAALNQRRRRGDRPHDSISGVAAAAPGGDSFALAVRGRYGMAYDAALCDALGRLPDRQRILLRLHYAEGWSIDRLAPLYRVGRSTAARWLAAARDDLLSATMALLRERLGLSSAEMMSLATVLQSALEVSVLRLLGPAQG
jgi:RNA polymerase sigma-70 factor (ECF subfamily)